MALTNHIVPDSPTNNFCTWNKLAGRNKNSSNPFLQPTFSEGNTKVVAHSSEVTHAIGTIASTGKHYAEFIVSGGTSTITGVGVISSEWDKSNLQSYIYNFEGALYAAVGTLYSNTTTDTSPIAITTSFRVGIEVDFGANEVAFFKVESNGTRTQQGSTITTNIDFKGSGSFAASLHNSNDYIEAYFIEDDWWGTPNSGYTALCTANLPDFTPTVTDDVPQDYFKAVKYVGDYSSPATISVGFNPDLVWIKQRTPYASQSHCIYDSVRGVSKRLSSDSTSQEITPDGNGGVTNFSDNNGFELTRPTNAAFEGFDSSMQMIAWCWKAGGAPTADNSNTSGAMTANSVSLNGTLQSNYTPAGSPTIYPKRMSINTDAGFSIIKWVGNNTNNATIPHGLTKEPDFVIIKNLIDTTIWIVKLNPNTNPAVSNEQQYLYLNLTNNFGTNTGEETQLTTNTIKFVGTSLNNTNGSGDDMVAYCWHSVEGYSKFGSYTGNGSTDGPMVYCGSGFRPAFVMIKQITTTSDYSSWAIFDNARDPSNPTNYLHSIYANRSAQEGKRGDGTSANSANVVVLDILSNGFKLRDVGGGEVNQDTKEYIFIAFAEQPFKFSNAR